MKNTIKFLPHGPMVIKIEIQFEPGSALSEKQGLSNLSRYLMAWQEEASKQNRNTRIAYQVRSPVGTETVGDFKGKKL